MDGGVVEVAELQETEANIFVRTLQNGIFVKRDFWAIFAGLNSATVLWAEVFFCLSSPSNISVVTNKDQ